MNQIKRIALVVGICSVFMTIYIMNPKMMPRYDYTLTASAEVDGRQGVAVEGEYYWVSGSASLAKYDKNWNMIALNQIYCGLELFLDGVSKNIQIAIYDGDTLEQNAKQFLLLYNRGARIVNGMPTGFYDGYDHEIHEIFVWEIHEFRFDKSGCA